MAEHHAKPLLGGAGIHEVCEGWGTQQERVVEPACVRAAMIRMLDHTADVGFELEAPTLEALFDEARQALLMTLFEEPPKEGRRAPRAVVRSRL